MKESNIRNVSRAEKRSATTEIGSIAKCPKIYHRAQTRDHDKQGMDSEEDDEESDNNEKSDNDKKSENDEKSENDIVDSCNSVNSGSNFNGIDEANFLQMYRTNSGRQLFKLRPDVWTSHGKWRKHFKHLESRCVKDNEGQGPGGSHGRVTNRPFVTWFRLNGRDIQAGIVENPETYQRIVISFTRASSAPPTYGSQGMFDRGATAARAWVAITPQAGTSVIVSLPRARMPSKRPLQNTDSLISELQNVLNAAPDQMAIELLSVGINGLTTDVGSLIWIFNKWSRLNIRLVFVVPNEFPGSQIAFPTLSNGVRYGNFVLSDVVRSTQSSMEGSVPTERCSELLHWLHQIRNYKDDREAGYAELALVTFGRANFRVCPLSESESGIDEATRQTRGLHNHSSDD